MTTAARRICVDPEFRRKGSMGICGAIETAEGGASGAGAGGSAAPRLGGKGAGTVTEGGGKTFDADATGAEGDAGANGSFESGRSVAIYWPDELTTKLNPAGILPRDCSVCVNAAQTSLELPPPMNAPAGLAQYPAGFHRMEMWFRAVTKSRCIAAGTSEYAA